MSNSMLKIQKTKYCLHISFLLLYSTTIFPRGTLPHYAFTFQVPTSNKLFQRMPLDKSFCNYSSSSHLSEDFREFLKKDLIEVSSLIQLEQSGRLNWWAETGTCQRLWPIGEYIYLEYRPRQPNWEYTM